MGGIIFYAMFSITGAGAGLFMAVIAGAAGNLATALAIPAEYHSIGASGSIFGAFGILASYRIVMGSSAAGKPDWKPAAAALAFLGFFGTSEGSDIFGHLFSLMAGFLTGFIGSSVTASRKKQPSRAPGVIFGMAALVIIAFSWMKAIGGL
jgi:membrane associated rhomboid family serine protease